MKFILVDRIIALAPPERIVTSKCLTLAEEYLADHFPTFPVMPGVLMLESMVQSAAWLVRAAQDFSHSMVVLEEARNVNYKSFVSPGRTLEVTVESIRIEERTSEFRAFGRCDDKEMVKARLRLRHYNMADEHAEMSDVDKRIISDGRQRFKLLGGPSALKSAAMTAGEN
ncbi:MAG: beta-hydroxyacyl-ACP dehydratase [Planctomycetota bacterium]|nr:beta-hydroxyacyl-ACP dehydratase [Planctomycetota bacterium]